MFDRNSADENVGKVYGLKTTSNRLNKLYLKKRRKLENKSFR